MPFRKKAGGCRICTRYYPAGAATAESYVACGLPLIAGPQ